MLWLGGRMRMEGGNKSSAHDLLITSHRPAAINPRHHTKPPPRAPGPKGECQPHRHRLPRDTVLSHEGQIRPSLVPNPGFPFFPPAMPFQTGGLAFSGCVWWGHSAVDMLTAHYNPLEVQVQEARSEGNGTSRPERWKNNVY